MSCSGVAHSKRVRAAAEPGSPTRRLAGQGPGSCRRGACRRRSPSSRRLTASSRCARPTWSRWRSRPPAGPRRAAQRGWDEPRSLYIEAGDAGSAARCGFWIGIGLLSVGASAQAGGWFARASRLLDRADADCVERGYLMVPGCSPATTGPRRRVPRRRRHRRDRRTVPRCRSGGVRGARPGPGPDQAGAAQGMALLDEAMVAVVAGELSSPLFTGLIYCQVIGACEEVFEVRRTREWTDELTRWCEAQPQLVDFTGICLVHRADACSSAGRGRMRSTRRAGPRRFAPGEPGAGAADTGRARSTGCGVSRRRRGRLPGGVRAGLAAPTRARVAVAGAGTDRCGRGGDPPGARRDHRPARAGPAAAGLRRDHAGGGDIPDAQRLPRAADIAIDHGRCVGRDGGARAAAPSRWPR